MTIWINLKKNITKSIDEVEESIQNDISQLSDDLAKRKQAVDQLENDVNITKKHASDLQMCLGMRNFQTKLVEEEQYVSSLQESGMIKSKRIKFDINKQMQGITTSIESFGTLTTEETPILLKHAEHKQGVQIITRPQSTMNRSIYDINVNLRSKLDVPIDKRSFNITGCTINSDGQIILANRENDTLLILSADF